MTFLEKKSFYSFLGLYIISSSLFIIFSAYWYYNGQKNALENSQYYKLEHIADKLSQKIINAHMHDTKLILPSLDKDIIIALIDVDKKVQYGSLVNKTIPSQTQYYKYKDYNVLVSDAVQEHLHVEFVVVQSNVLDSKIIKLKKNILIVMSISIFIMIVLAYVLSRLFMRPIHQKIQEIEDFISDTAHELNTPITALRMSVSSLLKKKTYDKKGLENISISTKQLFDIYNSLSYLSFDSKKEELKDINLCFVLNQSILYYEELTKRKKIILHVECEEYKFKIDETKLTMLFGNLINNAIKYSPANSKIEISLKKGVLKIKDYGIGISEDKQSAIFERFNRQTEYSGGFGIGLSIVKKISQEYDIKLEVESELDKGTCFTLRF